MFRNLPREVTENEKFCLWRYEQKADKDKPDKVPYQPNGKHAVVGTESTFYDFETIVSASDEHYSGIGVHIKNYCYSDIDHCVENGILTPFAQEIVDKMNTYTEFSPSGTGLRFIFTAHDYTYDKSRYYENNRKIGMEMYFGGCTTKFITVTGNVIRDVSIRDCSDVLPEIMDKYMSRPIDDKPKTTAPGSYLSDESIIEKAMSSKQTVKFEALWGGEIPDGKSHSEADMALAQILAFWCGGDIEQMDRLFRQSKLMRDKWDRPQSGSTYGQITLEKAVANCTTFYKPLCISSPQDDFDDVLQLLQELNPVDTPRYKSADMGNGRLLADVYRDIARYVPERKCWYVYDGKRWAADIGSLKVMELCKTLADKLVLYALTIHDEVKRHLVLKISEKWQLRRSREIFMKEAQSVYPVSMQEFDQNKYLFNCSNVTIDLQTGNAHGHRAEDMITKISPVDYVPTATSSKFRDFINEVMSHDKEKAVFLQKILGYALSGDTRFECMFILYGMLTRNGKGTLMESILRVMGDYGKAVRAESIAQKWGNNSQNPSEDIARLAGVRFANISEPSKGLVLNAAQVKSMTGNDTLNARFLHENSFDFQPQFKLYINTNYLPVINDMTLFSSGRIMIIPFDRHFEEWEQDKTLKTEFAKPEVQSAILNWLMEGYAALERDGLNPPQSVTAATQAYCRESDKIHQFAEDCLSEDINGEAKTAAVYEEYRSWCMRTGCYAENMRNFNQELRKLGTIVRKRPKEGGEKTTLLTGFTIKDDFLKAGAGCGS